MSQAQRIKTRKLLELLGEPEFYMQCPEYFFMREMALPIIARWQEGSLKFPEQSLQIPLEAFIRNTLAMQEAFQHHGPDSVVHYLQTVLGYPEGRFIVYYKRGQQEAQELCFHLEQGGSDGEPRDHVDQV